MFDYLSDVRMSAWQWMSQIVTLTLSIVFVICSSQSNELPSLLRFKESLGANTLDSWTGDNPCGDSVWKGIECTDGQVTKL